MTRESLTPPITTVSAVIAKSCGVLTRYRSQFLSIRVFPMLNVEDYVDSTSDFSKSLHVRGGRRD